jgi:transposase
MAKTNALISFRSRRIFSDALKKKLVKEIEQNKVTVTKVSREYQVSYQAVYAWLRKFSSNLYPTTTIVMQMDSEQYRTKELEKKIAELEAALGRKQMEIDFLNKMIEIADQDLGTDIKKNIVTPVSSGSEKTKGKNDSS